MDMQGTPIGKGGGGGTKASLFPSYGSSIVDSSNIQIHSFNLVSPASRPEVCRPYRFRATILVSSRPANFTAQVTSESADPIKEGTGAIASDSLAAESARSGGALSSEQPMSVSGSKSTLNNTDTSGATTLPPTRDAEGRGDDDVSDSIKGPGGVKYAEGLGGQGTFSGQHSEGGYVGGPSRETQGGGGSAAGRGLGESQGATKAESAPDYAEDAPQGNVGGPKPKGKNITEGGFDEDAPNASYTTEIGTDQDPGRLGMGDAQRRAAESGADAGGGPRQKGIDGGQGGFDVLSSERDA